MKKILAIIAVLATVLSLASCKMKNNKTTAELVSEAEVERSMLIESSIQAESQREEKIVENIGEIGKSEKKKQLVLKRDEDHYQVFVMNKKNICTKVRDYYFFESIEAYNIKVSDKEKGRQKLVHKDPESRMLVYESDYDIEERNTYDQIYEFFSDPRYAEVGIIIVE